MSNPPYGPQPCPICSGTVQPTRTSRGWRGECDSCQYRTFTTPDKAEPKLFAVTTCGTHGPRIVFTGTWGECIKHTKAANLAGKVRLVKAHGTPEQLNARAAKAWA